MGVFDERLRSGEDWGLFLRLSQSTMWAYIDVPVVTITVRADATHLLYCCENKLNLIRMLQHERRRCHHPKNTQRAIIRGFVRHYKQLYWFHVARNNRLAAARSCWKGFLATGALGFLARMLGSFCLSNLRRAMKRALLVIVDRLQGRSEKEKSCLYNEAA